MSSKPNILIVDDEKLNIDLTTELLKENYNIKIARSGEEALTVIDRFSFDLVLLDIHMPKLDGYQLAQKLQKNPKTQHTPIIFLTADQTSYALEKGFAVGGKDVITKPFKVHELIIRINNKINNSKNEQKLQQNNQLISDIINRTNTIIIMINNNGVLTKINQYGEDFIGFSQNKIHNEPYFWEEYFPSDMNTKVKMILEKQEIHKELQNFKTYITSSDGQKKLFEWHNTLIKKDNGTLDYLICIGLEDSNSQINIENNDQNEIETLMNNSNDGIAIFDLEANFLDCNNIYLSKTGYSKEELLARNCLDLTHPDDKNRSIQLYQKVLKDGHINDFEKSIVTKDGTLLTLSMNLSLMPDKQRILATTKNITETNLLDSQAKLASMADLIENIAHQWRQPLTVISTIAGSTTLKHIMNNLNPDEIVSNMSHIEDQAIYLSRVIDDFRNFIKDDGDPSIVDPNKIIDKALSILNPTISNSYIEIQKHYEATQYLSGFENEYIQAIVNIINNAVDAIKLQETTIDKGYIDISSRDLDDIIEITISDNGGGIDPLIINRIFEPYFTTKHKSVGVGLGLTMAYKIISKRNNGDIKIENIVLEHNDTQYVGSKVTITLPKAKIDECCTTF